MSYADRMASTVNTEPSRDACCPPGVILIPESTGERFAALFKALGDPVRLRLLCHIASNHQGTACACHLPNALGVSQPTLSHHLKKLVDAGLISREQRGRWAHYTVTPAALADMTDFLAALNEPLL